MRKSLLTTLLLSSVAILIGSGCAGVPRSFKETTLDDMYPILTQIQYDTLKSLSSDHDINRFIERFWQEIHAIPDDNMEGVRSEYLRRLQYANEHFPDRRG